MTAALFFVPAGALAPAALAAASGEVVLDGPEGHHAATVRRLGVGEVVQVSDGAGLVGRGEVRAVGHGRVRIAVTQVVPASVPGPRFVLVQALAKGGRDEQAVEVATELGVDEIVAWQAQRSVVVWRGDRSHKSLKKWESVALAAAKQSRRATIPQVDGPVTTAQLAARLRSSGERCLVLHEDAERPLADVAAESAAGTAGAVLVVVGPEGGISEGELEQLTGAGGVPVRLGPTILRASSAGPAALAILSAARRWR